MLRTTFALLAAICLLALGCYSAPVMPPTGFLYSNIEAPVSPAVRGEPIGPRRGVSESVAVLGLFAWGDASVEAATQNGGIRSPKHIDYEYFNFLGLYQKFTTVVHGE